MNLNFFPVIYFVGPCFAGVLIQFLFYGITSSWVLVAVALIFVQMQSYAENLYMDDIIEDILMQYLLKGKLQSGNHYMES